VVAEIVEATARVTHRSKVIDVGLCGSEGCNASPRRDERDGERAGIGVFPG
jgi:hypothetical protein